MVPTPTQEFCAHLRSIVMLLEKRDWAGAAAEAVEMEKLVATLPLECPSDDLREAQQLLARYEALGTDLQQSTVAAMAKLGTAQRLRAYRSRP